MLQFDKIIFRIVLSAHFDLIDAHKMQIQPRFAPTKKGMLHFLILFSGLAVRVFQNLSFQKQTQLDLNKIASLARRQIKTCNVQAEVHHAGISLFVVHRNQQKKASNNNGLPKAEQISILRSLTHSNPKWSHACLESDGGMCGFSVLYPCSFLSDPASDG